LDSLFDDLSNDYREFYSGFRLGNGNWIFRVMDFWVKGILDWIGFDQWD
jgi:hypothetical protein